MKKDETYKKEVGNRLKEALKQAGIKHTELAKELGIAINTVSQWTKGLREPKYEILHYLFKKYKINPNFIILGIEEPIFKGANYSKITSLEEEQIMKETYIQIIKVLENYKTPLKIVPESVFKKWQEEIQHLSGIEKVFSFLKNLPQKTLYTLYSSAEIISSRFLFFINPYWEQMIEAIWGCYWAFITDKIPFIKDIAILGVLYSGEKDFTKGALLLQRILRENKIAKWDFSEKEIKEGLKGEILFKPLQENEIHPLTYAYLRQAGRQLVDLAILKKLPEFCIVHSKAYWTECPICLELKNKDRFKNR